MCSIGTGKMRTIYADKRAAAAGAAAKVAIFGLRFEQTKDQMMQICSRCRFVYRCVASVFVARGTLSMALLRFLLPRSKLIAPLDFVDTSACLFAGCCCCCGDALLSIFELES